MPCTVSGVLSYLDAAGTVQVLANKKVYLIPSRTDFMWTPNGSTWYPWEKNENLPTAYQYGVEGTTNGSGAFSFNVPYTDTEVLLPVSSTSPSLVWNIVDPLTGKVYYGPVLAATVGVSKTLKELTQLASPNDWKIAGTVWSATPVFTGFEGTATITDASAEIAVAFAVPTSTANYRVLLGWTTDDSSALTTYVVNVKAGTQTVNGFTLKASQTPPTGKVVSVYYRVTVP